MSRVPFLLLVLACGEPDTVPTESTPSTETGTPPLPTTGTEPAIDLFAPPTGVGDACWSWQVEYDGGSLAVRERVLRVHNPVTLEVTHLEKDRDADGLMDYIGDYLYEPQFGHLVARQLDVDGDGVVDEITRWVYDDVGLLVEQSIDRNGDGTRDTIWTYTYDGALRLTAEEDEAGDGIVDALVTYTYDDADRTLTIVEDVGNDGIIDNLTTFLYEDDTGPNVEITQDDGNDGLIDRQELFRYDPLGRLAHYETSLDNGFSASDDYKYTMDGDISTYEREIFLDEVWTQYEKWTYVYVAPHKPQSVLAEYYTELGAAVPALTIRSDYTWTCP